MSQNDQASRPSFAGLRGEGKSVLGALLHPNSEKEFLDTTWEKAPCFVARRNTDFFAGIFSAREIDSLVSLGANASRQHLRLVKAEGGKLAELPVELNAYGTADVFPVYRAYDSGYTIVANNLDTRWLSASELCRGLEEELRYRTVANLYVTPASAQGFPAHYDSHDVLVLQLEGSKLWRVYQPSLNLPLDDSGPEIEPKYLAKPFADFHLQCGDLLYLPRGWIHEATTSDRSSVHLTVGIHVTRWMDVVMDALSAAASAEERLRTAVPTTGPGLDKAPAEVTKELRDLLHTLVDRAPLESAIERRQRRALGEGNPVPDGHFVSLDRAYEIDLDTVVGHRPGLVARVYRSGGQAVIQFRGNSVRGPEELEATFQFIAGRSRLTARELPGLDDEGKVALVRRLVVEGLLAIQ